LRNDPQLQALPPEAELVYGDVTERSALEAFFADSGEKTCVIHCAGIVSIASAPGAVLQQVNVLGTKNIVALCQAHHVGKLVYVSSVHALAECPAGECSTERSAFSPDDVRGAYAKSKAEATEYVLQAARTGLNASVVQPSGILGPGDPGRGSISWMLRSYCAGKLPAGVQGGYDFVDVRDVAEGILSCCKKGRSGECYILSGRYVSIRELLQTARKLTKGRRILLYVPLKLARLVAPWAEKHSLKKGEPLFFTPYAIDVLATNARFSYRKAASELNYSARRFTDTLRDTLTWVKSQAAVLPEKQKAACRRAKRSLSARAKRGMAYR
jgi:dihydroflavonol-4-reductase